MPAYRYDAVRPMPYKFTGKERDSESGLDMFGARYYPLYQVTYWGDHTHPTASGLKKVADQLVIWIGKDPNHIKPGSPFLTWIQQ